MNSQTTEERDLDICAREPIHAPGAIQPHGALVALGAHDLRPRQASENFKTLLGVEPDGDIFVSAGMTSLGQSLQTWVNSDLSTFRKSLPDRNLTALAHRSGDLIILEFEPLHPDGADDLLARLANFAPLLATARTLQDALVTSARFIGRLSGFDRTLIYKFDEQWNGEVLAEWGNGALPSYLGLNFPAGDIPAQARKLYALNRSRIIPDIDYRPVALLALSEGAEQALDLSFAQLRSVAPIHLEYMRNMGTSASMSLSIMVSGKLWGLVACHSLNPHYAPPAIREACDFVVQSLAIRLASQAESEAAAQRARLAHIHGRLIAATSIGPTWREGLLREAELLLQFVDAQGAIITEGAEISALGRSPGATDLQALLDWLNARDVGDVIATDRLGSETALSPRMTEIASGVLAMRVSELHNSWLIWLRPEVVRTVTWSGAPHKNVHESGRIHPRASFEAWQEMLRGRARPWLGAEIDAARELRAAIINIVLKKAEELAQLSEELRRSNRELEAFSYSVSHDLRAPFRHIVGFAQLLREREPGLDDKSRHYLHTITDSAMAAGRLVDDLLNFSQLGRTAMASKPVDMNKLVAEVLRSLQPSLEGRKVEWTVETLPNMRGDATLLRQVWFNLIENAVKYTRPRDIARIAITGACNDETCLYAVTDNGVGFDMAYYSKLFGVFQRLQRVEDFEGTGIGLALARRIVERHGGAISAVGEPGVGARFEFTLPAPKQGDSALA